MLHEQGYIPPEALRGEKPNWEHLWEDRKSLIAVKLRHDHYIPIDAKHELNNALLRERCYVEKLVKRISEIIEQNQDREIIMLLDIDGTIANPGRGRSHDNLRPGFPIFIEGYLQPYIHQKVRIGLLTNHETEQTLEHMDDTKEDLSYLKPHVDRDIAFDTRCVTEEFDQYLESDEPFDFQRLQTIFSPQTLSDPSFRAMFTDAAHEIEKMLALQTVSRNLPRKACIVLIDDCCFPEYLNNEAGFYGISVNNEGYLLPPGDYSPS